MSGPWERFAPAPPVDGPWSKFKPSEPQTAMGTAKDAGASFGSGLMRGAVEAAMLPVTIPQLAQQGVDWLVKQLPGAAQGPMRAGAVNEAIYGAQDQARGAMDANLYAPQTTAGKYAKTVGEFIPGALMAPGGMAANALRYGVVPGIASEAAGQATEGTAAEPWARAGAGVVAGLGMAALQRPSTAQSAIEGMAGGAIPRAELQAADALRAEAASRGIRLTPIEALNQVTDGKYQRLSQTQRLVENSQGGAPVMGEFMAQRPGQVQRAGQQAFDQLAPNPAGPQQIGSSVQNASQGVITDANLARTAAVKPFYTAGAADTVPAANVQAVIAQIDDLIAKDPTGQLTQAARGIRQQLIEQASTPGTPAARSPVVDPRSGSIVRYEVTPATPGTPEIPRTNAGDLNEIAKTARDGFTFNGPRPLGATATEVQQARLASEALKPLNEALVSASPNIARGRELYGLITDRVNKPLEQGRVGALSQTNEVTAQRGILFPAIPEANSAAEVGQAVRQIAKKDPKAAIDLVGQHARTVFAEATQNNIPGGNQFGGAKFVAQIKGNPEQAASLEAAVKALPGGQTRWDGFSKFLDVLEATGKRLSKGSETAFNQTLTEQLQGGSAAGRAVTTGGVGIIKEIGRRWDQYQLSGKTEAIASLLTNSSAMGLFGRIAKESGVTPAAQALTVRLLAIAGNSAKAPEQAKSNPIPQVRQ